MESVDIYYTDQTHVSCDGGEGILGHPLVYLHLSPKGMCECPYCGRVYIFEPQSTKQEPHKS